MKRCWMIASGKGGVGKSMVTAGLGISLDRLGKHVCIVDADLGLRNQDALLGLENRIVYDLMDVTEGHCTLDQALISPECGQHLMLLPAAQFARAKELDPRQLKKILNRLRERFDFILIDCPAGIERGLRNVLKAGADAAVLVCTPDDICMRDAERAGTLMMAGWQIRPELIVNRLNPKLIRSGEMYAAKIVAETLDMDLLGEIPEDLAVTRAVLSHHSPAEYRCEAGAALERIAKRMTGLNPALPGIGLGKPTLFKRIFHRHMDELVPRR